MFQCGSDRKVRYPDSGTRAVVITEAIQKNTVL
jgi:hypothetical protein